MGRTVSVVYCQCLCGVRRHLATSPQEMSCHNATLNHVQRETSFPSLLFLSTLCHINISSPFLSVTSFFDHGNHFQHGLQPLVLLYILERLTFFKMQIVFLILSPKPKHKQQNLCRIFSHSSEERTENSFQTHLTMYESFPTVMV